MKRSICLILSFLVLVTALTGCGSPAVQSAEEAPAVVEASGYRTAFLPLSDAGLTDALKNAVVIGDSVYFTSLGVLEDQTPEGVTPAWPEQYWVYGPVLCRVEADGTLERMSYTPSGLGETNSGVIFEQLCPASDGTLWLLEKHYRTVKEQDAVLTDERYELVCLRPDGSVTADFPLDGLRQRTDVNSGDGSTSFAVQGMASDASGRVVLAVQELYTGAGSYSYDSYVCVVDGKTGALIRAFSADSDLEQLTALADGRIAVLSYSGGSETVGILDVDAQMITGRVPVEGYPDALISAPEADTLLYSEGDALYSLDLNTGSSEKLLSWVNCDVAHERGASVCALSDGRIVTTASHTGSAGVENELIMLSPDPGGNATPRQTLRLAVMNLSPATGEMISRFNRSQRDVRIEVVDYAQFNDYSSDDAADWMAGLTRLQTEMIAGNVPDIIDISLLSADRLGAKGILEDLYPYIDADPELSRADLMEHVLAAWEEDGKLYQTISNFYILTTAGLSRNVGYDMGWTRAEFNAAMAELLAVNPQASAFDSYTTRDDILTFMLYLELEGLVDWHSGACSFDSESFRQLLSFVKTFPAAYNWAASGAEELDTDGRMLAGMQLLKQCNFTKFEDVQVNTIGLRGEDCTFIGYPTESGVGSMFAQIGNSFAISAACADKDAAWQFVRQFFLPEYQAQYVGSFFPTNRALYEQMKREAMTTQYRRNPDGSYLLDEDGQRVEADRGSAMVGGLTYAYQTVTEAEAALVEQIIDATDHVLHVDSSLEQIIKEGAAAYFADQRELDEVVRTIQSRAALYVSEQS